MPVDPELVDLRIDQRVVADKHVNLGQHDEITFISLSRYTKSRMRGYVAKIMLFVLACLITGSLSHVFVLKK